MFFSNFRISIQYHNHCCGCYGNLLRRVPRSDRLHEGEICPQTSSRPGQRNLSLDILQPSPLLMYLIKSASICFKMVQCWLVSKKIFYCDITLSSYVKLFERQHTHIVCVVTLHVKSRVEIYDLKQRQQWIYLCCYP